MKLTLLSHPEALRKLFTWFKQQKIKGEDRGKPSPKGTRREDVPTAHRPTEQRIGKYDQYAAERYMTKGEARGKPSPSGPRREEEILEPKINIKGEAHGKPSLPRPRREDEPKGHKTKTNPEAEELSKIKPENAKSFKSESKQRWSNISPGTDEDEEKTSLEKNITAKKRWKEELEAENSASWHTTPNTRGLRGGTINSKRKLEEELDENATENATRDETHQDEEMEVIKGLQNMGNTCYLNAALQVLASCNAFVEVLTNSKTADKEKRTISTQLLEVCEFLANFSHDEKENTHSAPRNYMRLSESGYNAQIGTLRSSRTRESYSRYW